MRLPSDPDRLTLTTMWKTVAALLLIGVTLTTCGSESKIGAPCTQNSDCASGLCTGGPNCGKVCACARDSDCQAGLKCGGSIDCGPMCQ